MLRLRYKPEHLLAALGQNTKNHPAYLILAKAMSGHTAEVVRKRFNLLKPRTWFVKPEEVHKEAICGAKALFAGSLYGSGPEKMLEEAQKTLRKMEEATKMPQGTLPFLGLGFAAMAILIATLCLLSRPKRNKPPYHNWV